jgi:uncharacterized RDD family membrane protein YckC
MLGERDDREQGAQPLGRGGDADVPDSERALNAAAGTPAAAHPAKAEARPPVAPLRPRFVAAVIDLGLFWLSLAASFLGFWQTVVPKPSAAPALPSDLLEFAMALALLACPASVIWQAVRITSSGQSLGKRRMGLRVERLDGSPAGFYHGVFLRSWVMALLYWAPWGELLVLAGYALILRDSRRCLHDELAKTRVVAIANAPAPPSAQSMATNML